MGPVGVQSGAWQALSSYVGASPDQTVTDALPPLPTRVGGFFLEGMTEP